MKKIIDNCVGCTDIGLQCIGKSCPNKAYLSSVCDSCEREVKLYKYNGGEYCSECILDELEEVEYEE